MILLKRWISKDGVSKLVNDNRVDQYLLDGWVLGRGPGFRINSNTFGFVWIHNKDNYERKVNPNELERFLNNGWVIGRKSGFKINNKCEGRIRIHKESSEKVIYPEELEMYLSDGWLLGFSENHCNNLSKNHADFTGSNSPFYGKTIPDNTRSKIRLSVEKAYLDGRLTPHNNNVSYKMSYGNDIYLRSSYEAYFLVWLLCNNLEFEYESVRLKYPSGRVYIPDFYLPESNTIIEIKGRSDQYTLDLLESCKNLVISNNYNWVSIIGDEIYKYYSEVLYYGVNIDELSTRLASSNPKVSILHWYYSDGIITFKDD